MAYLQQSQPGIHRVSRSWTDDNGVHHTIQSASYTSPTFSFQATGVGSTNTFFQAPQTVGPRHRQRQSSGGLGLFGAALGLLDGLLPSHNPSHRNRGHTSRRRIHVEDLNEHNGEDGLAYNNLEEHQSFSPLFSDFFDNPEARRTQRLSPSRELSPNRQSRRGYSSRQMRYPSDIDETNDNYSEQMERDQRTRGSRSNGNDEEMIRALEVAVEHCENQVKNSRRRYAQLTMQSRLHPRHLDALLHDIEAKERDLATAKRHLREAREMAGLRENQRAASGRSWPPQSSFIPRDLFDDFDHPFFNIGFSTFNDRPRPQASSGVFPDPHLFNLFASFGMDGGMRPDAGLSPDPDPFNFFEGMGMNSTFGEPFSWTRGPFTNSNWKQTRPTPNNASQSESMPSFNPSSGLPPRPPPTLLTPTEAKKLFNAYNNRWNTLSPADPNIPYPARGLQASALVKRDTIWAPHVNAHPSTWSDEAVMKANVQAFFLNVADLAPHYTESPGTGRVEMGFDKSKASPAQVKQLVEILKKEKMRWHSDRLGRRNGGAEVPNEALQSDERARAVFHAVCELMEVAQ